ncbi:MAG: coproporphyrinogen dehydrogenase HemZ [Oscillospiraceae bacterium]|jgi:oxygen-independent coproporphyrinogen-3 oxidase|nr:coproporphyrinogen dehydrogenase HemZ [Oscillospiraceae bacterium]
MTLTLIGHDRRFAVEQAVFNYFPKRDGGSATVTLSEDGRLASAVIEYNGKTAGGSACVPQDTPPDNALRMAFYCAAKQLTEPPPWGALTGVRPVKKAIELLDSGQKVLKGLQNHFDVSPERAQMASDCAASAVSLRDRLERKDIALYIGIPFCPTRCSYCSFVSSSVERDAGLIERYIDVLYDEIGLAGQAVSRLGLRIRAVYWGGGTPAVLSPEQFLRLSDALRNCFALDTLWEYTVEAGRPDSITPDKLVAYRAGGATRISVNPQTLDQSVLDAIGRRHTPQQFFAAYEQARASGFDCINIDLIAGLPGDDTAGFFSGLDRVLPLLPENITIHTLAKKRASRVSAEQTAVCPAGTVAAMLDGASLRLRESGYAPYYLYRQKFSEGGFENTGWSKPGRECIYNLCMMEELCSVLSLGAGGVTKAVVRGAEGSVNIKRGFHCKYPLEYVQRRDTISDILAVFAASVGEH